MSPDIVVCKWTLAFSPSVHSFRKAKGRLWVITVWLLQVIHGAYPHWVTENDICGTPLSHRSKSVSHLSFLFQVPLSPGWRGRPGLGSHGFLRCAGPHPRSVDCGADFLAWPAGCAQVGVHFPDELADALSPGAALHRILSSRTSFHEVKLTWLY